MNRLGAQIRLILRNDLRLLWRDLRSGKLQVFANGVFGGIALLAFHALALALFFNLRQPPTLVIENIAWVFFTFLMLGSAMNHAIVVLFERSDFDLLIASPVSPRAILLARLISMTIGAWASAALLLLPALDSAVIALSRRYIAGYFVWALLAAIVASGGIWFSLALVRWLGPRRARMWIQVLAGVLGAMIYLAFQSQNYLPLEYGSAVWRTCARVLATPAFLTIARAGRGQPLAFAELATVAALVVALTARQLARIFISGVQEAGARPTKKRIIGRYHFAQGLRRATFRKDTRLIARDPLLLSQVLPSAMYFLPLVLPFGRGNFSAAVPSLAVALAANFSAILTAVAVSGDEGWDLIRMSPASNIQLRLAKMAAGMAFPVGLAAVLCVVVAALGRPWLGLIAFIAATGCALGCAWLEVVVVRPTPRQDIVRRQGAQRSWPRSMAQLALISAGAVGTALIARDMALIGSFCLGAMILGVIACFTLATVQDLPSE